MSIGTGQSAPDGSNMMPDLAKIELQQAIDTFRNQHALLIQLTTALMSANVLVVLYALSNRVAGAIIIAIVFPLLVLYIYDAFGRAMLPVAFTVLCIELKYGNSASKFLARNYLSASISVDYVKRLESISLLSNDEEIFASLRQVGLPLLRRGKVILIALLILLTIAPLILALFFGWRLF